MKKKITAVLCAALMIFPSLCVNADFTEKELKEAYDKAVQWKEENDSPYYAIGTAGADFYIMALSRMGAGYDYGSYLSGLDGIAAGYGAEHNASDMQRTLLATVASGGEARNVGGRDMVADAVYYRNNVAPIDREGVNGYSWALIALDSMNFETPEWALTNRNDLITGILSHQNTDGSFDGDVYATASAVTALAPYCDTSGAYTVTQNQTGDTFDLTPADAVENALDYLSDEQGKYGDFGDLKSTAMTVIALDAADIDADDDGRFTAKSGTALDGLMRYREKDGGFSADRKDSDGEATSLALCALTSHIRYMQGKSSFFMFGVNDPPVFTTQTPATQRPATSSSGSSSSSTSRPKTTPKPRTTSAPKRTSRPANTLKPTKTTTPKSEVSPKPTMTPRPTRRPALVGPVELPGPMPSYEPERAPEKNMAESESKSNSAGAAAAIVIAVLAACALAVIVLVKKGIISGDTPFVGQLFAKKKKNKTKKARSHRRTEQHRRYEVREKYKIRGKYKKHHR